MDLFPAICEVDGRRYDTCRVHYDGTNTTVWHWDTARRLPIVVAEGPGPLIPAESGWTLGEALVIRQHGCGCGHPMRRWRPGAAPARSHTRGG